MRIGKPIALGLFVAVIVLGFVLAAAVLKGRSDVQQIHTHSSQQTAQTQPLPPEPPAAADSSAESTASSKAAELRLKPLTLLEQAQSAAAQRGHYLAALFYDPDAPQSQSVLTQLSEVIEAEYQKRMELFEVPVTDPDHQAAVRLMGVFTTPAVLVFAPSNAVTHHFKDFGDVSGELSKAFLSPKMEEIMAGLQQRKVIFVHVWPAQDTMYQQNREQLEGLAQLLATSVRVIYIQADASEEQQLLREVIKLDPAKEAPVTLVLSRNLQSQASLINAPICPISGYGRGTVDGRDCPHCAFYNLQS